ncbi:MAG: CRISPR-associated endonuclease Cas2 [Pleurocapsa sp.]
MSDEKSYSLFSIHTSSLKKTVFYVIVYDIPDDKRRKRISDLLEGYGSRVQYSVFECVLNKQQYKQLCSRLQKIIKLDEDNIRVYPITRHTLEQVETWGVGNQLTKPPSSIII